MSKARRDSKPIKKLCVKLHNRRVVGGLLADGTIVWRFKRLMPDRTLYQDSIRLSREAVLAMLSIMAKFDSE